MNNKARIRDARHTDTIALNSQFGAIPGEQVVKTLTPKSSMYNIPKWPEIVRLLCADMAAESWQAVFARSIDLMYARLKLCERREIWRRGPYQPIIKDEPENVTGDSELKAKPYFPSQCNPKQSIFGLGQ